VATRTLVVNNKKTLKLLKKKLQFTSQVIQIKPPWEVLQQKEGFFFKDVNLMKYNLQKSNIHDLIESKLNLEA